LNAYDKKYFKRLGTVGNGWETVGMRAQPFYLSVNRFFSGLLVGGVV
jgi:hypothetical protein